MRIDRLSEIKPPQLIQEQIGKHVLKQIFYFIFKYIKQEDGHTKHP